MLDLGKNRFLQVRSLSSGTLGQFSRYEVTSRISFWVGRYAYSQSVFGTSWIGPAPGFAGVLVFCTLLLQCISHFVVIRRKDESVLKSGTLFHTVDIKKKPISYGEFYCKQTIWCLYSQGVPMEVTCSRAPNQSFTPYKIVIVESHRVMVEFEMDLELTASDNVDSFSGCGTPSGRTISDDCEGV